MASAATLSRSQQSQTLTQAPAIAAPVVVLGRLFYALIFLTKTEVRTVPVGAIAELVRGDVFYWGQLMAAALLGSIPVAIIYSFFVEHYVAGLTAGSVKG